MRSQNKFALAGAALAFGALVKFYPILFVPLFAFSDSGRVQLRIFVTAAMVFLVSMIAAFLLWGAEVFSPFMFATERPPKMLSILRLLEPLSAYFHGETLIDLLIDHNSIMVVAVASAFGLYCILSRLDWRVAASTGILLILMTYKVGHPHFFLPWLAAYAWLGTQSKPELRKLYTRAFAPLAGFLSGFAMIVLASGFIGGQPWYLSGPWAILRPLGAGFFMLFAL